MCLVYPRERPARLLICIHVENNPINFTDPTGHCKRPGECVVVGGSGGPLVNASYATLVAKIAVLYAKDNEQTRAYPGHDPENILSGKEILYSSMADANTIVSAHQGDFDAALHSYNTLDFLAEGAALGALAAGMQSPFGQPLKPQSISLNYTSTSGTGSNLVRTAETSNAQFQFNTGHGFYRPHTSRGVTTDLRTTTLTPELIEDAIAQDLTVFRNAGGQIPSITGGSTNPLVRSMPIGNLTIEYRAVLGANGTINIGTYYMLP